MKKEKIYQKLFEKEVVRYEEIIATTREVIGEKSKKYIYNKYIKPLLDEGKLERIRKKIYVIVPPQQINKNYQPNKYLVGSKVRKKYYLGYHTALELHGAAQSVFNKVYVAIKSSNRFKPFQYKDIKYKPVFVKEPDFAIETKKQKNHQLIVSAKERTFVDCLDRPKYSGGWEETLKSLQRLKGVKLNKLIKILNHYDKKILYRKTGLVLDLFKQKSPYYEHISNEYINKLRDRTGENPMYLNKSENQKQIFDKKWRLYVPKNFKEKIRGV